MALVPTAEALALGASRYGDVDAPVVERTISSFNPNVLAVRDERIQAVAVEAGVQTVAASVEVSDVAIA